MIKQDFVMLIMNCQKYAKKAAFQKKTWLPKIPDYLIYYHVIGFEDLDTNYKFDDENRILWVKTPDDYNSLPKKVITAYNAVNEIFDFKYLFKTDDDQILVKPAFFDIVCKLIKTMNPTPHYGGYVVDVQRPYLSQYHRIHPELPSQLPIYITKYCSGRFYFLSKEAILNLLSKKEKIIREFLEDYAIGYNLEPNLKFNMLSLATNKFFTDIELSDFNKFEFMNKGRN
jgi:hypothetical protein